MSHVGVDNPYAHVERCDHLTEDGHCRLALEHPDIDPTFTAERQDANYACIAANPDVGWQDCRHFRSTTNGRSCRRCGLKRRPSPDPDAHPLVEEHHLSYPEEGHEITVTLCRWCHAKVHQSWGRINDDASPAPEAIAERERRRSRELDEAAFPTAAERVDNGDHR